MRPVLLSQHRVNAIDDISKIPANVGAEIDLRTWEEQIVLAHDPFQPGALFADWLKSYGKDRKGPILLNVKEDGLEARASELCEKAGLKNFFFIDVSFPTLRRLADQGFKHLSVRVSEFETIETARFFQGKIEWVWLDCFTGRVPERQLITELREMGYRIALVSPELQSYGEEVIRRHFQALDYLQPEVDCVCTKRPDLWAANFSRCS